MQIKKSLNQARLFLEDGLVVDNFAGGGGASTGIAAALGRSVDIAVNHDPEAVALHAKNHPTTRHYCEDVFVIDPVEATQGRKVKLAWFSPDCKHFSRAKGAKPVSKKIRGLAWVVIKWANSDVAPDVIMLENVEEFATWGPLKQKVWPGSERPMFDLHGKPVMEPNKAKRGETFRGWWKQLEKAGYKIEMRILKASDFGAPTIRKRLYIIARKDGLPIVWAQPTHGDPKVISANSSNLLPWRTAAECIDWSIPCPSIFERKKPLAENTLRRIAKGLKRYVIDTASPFIVNIANSKTTGRGPNVWPLEQPLRTITASNGHALVTPYVTRIGQTGGKGAYSSDVDAPLTTITSKAEHLLICPTLVPTGYGERDGQAPRILDIGQPLATVVGSQKHALVTAHLSSYYGHKSAGGNARGQSLDAPLNTQTTENRHAVVMATLVDAAHSDVSPDGVKRWGSGVYDIEKPLGTVLSSGGNQALVSAMMVKHFGDDWSGRKATDMREPMATVLARNTQNQLVTTSLIKMRGDNVGQPVDQPLATVSAQGTHHAEVRAFLSKYSGPDQDLENLGLVYIEGCAYQIVDIGMRMLSPRELYRAQGFPDSYVIAFDYDKVLSRTKKIKKVSLSKTAQVRMCGNSVSPPVAEALVRANVVKMQSLVERAA